MTGESSTGFCDILSGSTLIIHWSYRDFKWNKHVLKHKQKWNTNLIHIFDLSLSVTRIHRIYMLSSWLKMKKTTTLLWYMSDLNYIVEQKNKSDMYSTPARKVLWISCFARIFDILHVWKPKNSHGFCVRLAGTWHDSHAGLRVFFTERSWVIMRDTGIFCSYLEYQYCQTSIKVSCEEGGDVCVNLFNMTPSCFNEWN